MFSLVGLWRIRDWMEFCWCFQNFLIKPIGPNHKCVLKSMHCFISDIFPMFLMFSFQLLCSEKMLICLRKRNSCQHMSILEIVYETVEIFSRGNTLKGHPNSSTLHVSFAVLQNLASLSVKSFNIGGPTYKCTRR